MMMSLWYLIECAFCERSVAYKDQRAEWYVQCGLECSVFIWAVCLDFAFTEFAGAQVQSGITLYGAMGCLLFATMHSATKSNFSTSTHRQPDRQ